MAASTSSSTTAYDQEKFLESKLLARSLLKLVCSSVCDKVNMPKGAGTTAYFVRYRRMYVPVAALSEGVTPTASTFTLDQVTVTLDQWGDLITVTDIAQLTTKHPIMQQIMDLLSDNAQRVIDREIQIVWLANTNVLYGDGSTVSARPDITSSMKLTDLLITRAYAQLQDAGVPERGGPDSGYNVDGSGSIIGSGQNYVGFCGPQVLADIRTAGTSLGTWASVAMYANQKALYNAEQGTWLGIRWVVTNFIPKFTTFGNTTTAIASGATMGVTGFSLTANATGGALPATTTYYFKFTRKDLLRGFEECISIEHTQASGAGVGVNSFTVQFPSTAGYVYNTYFGSASGDANLKLAASNTAASGTVTITAASSSTTVAPASNSKSGTSGPTVHVVYIHGAASCAWVGLQALRVMVTPDEATLYDPLAQQRAVSYKFMAKAMVKDADRILRLEVASTF